MKYTATFFMIEGMVITMEFESLHPNAYDSGRQFCKLMNLDLDEVETIQMECEGSSKKSHLRLSRGRGRRVVG